MLASNTSMKLKPNNWTSELDWLNKRYSFDVFDICGYSTENEAEKLPSHWLILRQNLVKSSQNAEFIDSRQGECVHLF